MKTRIHRQGDHFFVRIPKSLAKEFGLKNNSTVNIDVSAGQLIVSPVETAPRSMLEELVAKITPENLHGEILW
jgi:antitoxin MazE